MKQLLSFLAGLALVAGLSLPVAAQAPETGTVAASSTAQSAAAAAPVLQPGDQIIVTVWRNDELSGTFWIGTEGAPVHPLYQRVVLTGVPLPEVKRRVAEFLSEFTTNPQFVFEARQSVSVGGEVNRPAVLQLAPGTTVAQAVGAAGGPTAYGRLDRVELLRGGERVLVNLHRAGDGLSSGETPIRSGDVIVVTRRTSVMRDYIAPASSMVTGVLAVWNILAALRR